MTPFYRGRQFEARYNDDQMIEIGRARERLAAYRDKIQPYPVLEGEPGAKPQVQTVVHRHSNMGKKEFDLLQQTAREVKHLSQKLAEKPTRNKSKYD